jgi:hypothetical protein
MEKVNLAQKFTLFDEYWSPKLVGELNGQYIKIAKLKGEFIWHRHEGEDEFFMVIKGRLTIRLRGKRVNSLSCHAAWNICRSPSRKLMCCCSSLRAH